MWCHNFTSFLIIVSTAYMCLFEIKCCVNLCVFLAQMAQRNKTRHKLDFGGPQHCIGLFHLEIFKEFGSHIFQQIISISMGTNCAPLLGDLLLYSYETEFMQKLIISKIRSLKHLILYSVRYIDKVLSINNPSFASWS